MINFNLSEMALEHGFTNSVPLSLDTLSFLPEVRDMCSSDVCRSYNKNWCCPPACGTLDECAEKAKMYQEGILVQTTSALDDPFDYETMMKLQETHHDNMLAFAKKLRSQGLAILPLGAGACTLCADCSYPDAPCVFPEDAMVSMEAFGLFVSDVCSKNDIPYYYGKNTLTYIGLYLFNR